eukprot:TRINITY_DN21635_c0_g1_i1.p1 TRINITY_DN21635_c0_g1~~TRINITY_DN21635_c0_g1_i1.p1  ORF type:complete len:575 (+),score=70.08 TRINITY_DN21635_c0_g1_i1:33-1727(+)
METRKRKREENESEGEEETVPLCIVKLLEKRRDIVKRLEEERQQQHEQHQQQDTTTTTPGSDFGSEATELIRGEASRQATTSISQPIMVPCTPQFEGNVETGIDFNIQDSYMTPGEASTFADPLHLPWSIPDSLAPTTPVTKPNFVYDASSIDTPQTPPRKPETPIDGTPLGKYLSGNKSEIVVDEEAVATCLQRKGAYKWAVNEDNVLHQAGYIIPPEGDVNRYKVAVGGYPCTLCLWSETIVFVYVFTSEEKEVVTPFCVQDDTNTGERSKAAQAVRVKRVGSLKPPEGENFACVLVPPDTQMVFLGTTSGGFIGAKVTPSEVTAHFTTHLHTRAVNCILSHSWSTDECLAFTASECVKITPFLAPNWDPAASITMPLLNHKMSVVVHCISLLDLDRPLLAGTIGTEAAEAFFLVWDFQQGQLLRKLEMPSGVRSFTALHGSAGLSVLWSTSDDKAIVLSSWLGTSWSQEPIITSKYQITTWEATSNSSYVFSSTSSHLSVHSVATGSLTAELNLLDGRQLMASPHKNQPPRYTVTSIALHSAQPIICFSDSSGLIWIYVAS